MPLLKGINHIKQGKMTTLPTDFISQTRAFMPDALWQKLLAGMAMEPPVSIRLNPCKCPKEGFEISLADGGVPWCRDGWYLKRRPNFTFDPWLHAGAYYVQEASSMFVDTVLRQYAGQEPLRVLDLCAAPGGKSTAAMGALPRGSVLMSNEPVRNRAQILSENIQKYGHPNIIVTNNYADAYARSGLQFDIIIADVPCSGEGMFRKDEGAIGEWSLGNVNKCQALQRQIIYDIWPCLQPGGLLIYSTCTFNTLEDEHNVSYIANRLGADVLPIETDDSWHITPSLLDGFTLPVCRFMPGVTRGEGLFMAALRKHGDAIDDKQRKAKAKKGDKRQKGKPNKLPSEISTWLKEPDSYHIERRNGMIEAIPNAFSDMYDTACTHLKTMHAGIAMGETKGKDIIPAHGLALSTAVSDKAFASAELTYEQAISYLRKEAVTLPGGTPRGYVIVRYKGLALGFEKNIGNRANNLYPGEWKIKSTHTPEGDNEIIKIG